MVAEERWMVQARKASMFCSETLERVGRMKAAVIRAHEGRKSGGDDDKDTLDAMIRLVNSLEHGCKVFESRLREAEGSIAPPLRIEDIQQGVAQVKTTQLQQEKELDKLLASLHSTCKSSAAPPHSPIAKVGFEEPPGVSEVGSPEEPSFLPPARHVPCPPSPIPCQGLALDADTSVMEPEPLVSPPKLQQHFFGAPLQHTSDARTRPGDAFSGVFGDSVPWLASSLHASATIQGGGLQCKAASNSTREDCAPRRGIAPCGANGWRLQADPSKRQAGDAGEPAERRAAARDGGPCQEGGGLGAESPEAQQQRPQGATAVVGIALGRDHKGKIVVVALREESPAHRSGVISPGDAIAEVGGRAVDPSSDDLRDVARLLCGEPGSRVRVAVDKPGAGRRWATLTREVPAWASAPPFGAGGGASAGPAAAPASPSSSLDITPSPSNSSQSSPECGGRANGSLASPKLNDSSDWCCSLSASPAGDSVGARTGFFQASPRTEAAIYGAAKVGALERFGAAPPSPSSPVSALLVRGTRDGGAPVGAEGAAAGGGYFLCDALHPNFVATSLGMSPSPDPHRYGKGKLTGGLGSA